MKVLRLSAVVVFVFGVLSVANRVSAQEEAPSQFEHIKGLEPLVGFWVGKDLGDDGQEIALFFRLTSNRSYLRGQLMPVSDERPVPVIGTMLIGRDHEKDQVSFWGFWDDQQSHGKVQVGDGTATWTESGLMYDGRKTSADVTMKIDGDEMTVDVTNRKVGDETLDDHHFAMTRRAGGFGRGGRGDRGRAGRGRGGRGGQ